MLYAKERGLSDSKIQFGYILKNIAQPFITMVGMSVSTCIGGSLVVEKLFSIGVWEVCSPMPSIRWIIR